jgi:hypothetical protein
MNAADETAGAELPSAFELPRLSIIHFMAWMAATAIAFLPYQALWQWESATNSASRDNVESSLGTATSILGVVAAGGSLFVAASLYHWRRRGWSGRLQPGHWLALVDTAEWLLAAWFAVKFATQVTWFANLGRPVIVCTCICCLWLASRRDEPVRWRLAFGAIALKPILTWALMLLPAVGLASLHGQFLDRVQRTTVQVLQLATLVAAMIGDARQRERRHWSHWLGAGMRLWSTLILAALYLAYLFL